MEYLDILDENGNKTGEIRERKEIHKNGYWHKGIHVWIINSKGELLVQRRSKNKDVYPNKLYVSVAGHPISGEDNMTSIIREFEEEIDLPIAPDDLEYLFTFSQVVSENDGKFLDNMFYDVYLVEKDIDLESLVLQEDEVSEIKYIHYKEFEKMVKSKHADIVSHPKEYELLFDILNKRFKSVEHSEL